MTIEMKKFGNLLNNRPAGKEAYFRLLQIISGNTNKEAPEEEIILDFSGVDILTPSFADELLSSLREKYGKDKIKINNADGVVRDSIEIIDRQHQTP